MRTPLASSSSFLSSRWPSALSISFDSFLTGLGLDDESSMTAAEVGWSEGLVMLEMSSVVLGREDMAGDLAGGLRVCRGVMVRRARSQSRQERVKSSSEGGSSDDART